MYPAWRHLQISAALRAGSEPDFLKAYIFEGLYKGWGA
jgi:hypothetical protein